MRRVTAAVTAVAIALTVGVTSSSALTRPPAIIRTQQIAGLNAVLGPQQPITTRDLAARLVTRNGYRVPMAQVRSEMRQMAAIAPAPRTIASIKPRPTTTTTVAPTTTTVAAYDPATSGMGAPGSFQACVAWRESSDGEASSDVYGILPYIWTDVIGFSGSPYYASLATQDAAFWKLYDMDGTEPWAPYDGC